MINSGTLDPTLPDWNLAGCSVVTAWGGLSPYKRRLLGNSSGTLGRMLGRAS